MPSRCVRRFIRRFPRKKDGSPCDPPKQGYGISIGDTNPHRPTAALSGAFRLVVLALRQQGFVRRCDNPSEIARCGVRSSFCGADLRSGDEKPAANPRWIRKGFEEAWAEICPQKPMRVRIPYAQI